MNDKKYNYLINIGFTEIELDELLLDEVEGVK